MDSRIEHNLPMSCIPKSFFDNYKFKRPNDELVNYTIVPDGTKIPGERAGDVYLTSKAYAIILRNVHRSLRFHCNLIFVRKLSKFSCVIALNQDSIARI